MALTKITEHIIKDSFKTAISGSDTSDMTLATASIAAITASISRLNDEISTDDTDMTLATASIAAITASVSRIDSEIDTNSANMTLATASIAAITASLGQPVNTDSNVTFGTVNSGDITSTGTITAVEVHTTFVSSSIAVISGSNNFGDATDDHHSFTGSLSISGSGTVTGSFTVNGDLVVKDNIDLEGDIDVNGTANLDIVDIDGAVDMASTLTVAQNIIIAQGKKIQETDGNAYISFDSGYHITGSSAGDIVFDIDNNANETDSIFRITANNQATELMRVVESGNVGIGTTGPGALLDVSAGGYTTAQTHAIKIGANIGANTARGDGTRKIGSIVGAHYDNDADDITILRLDSESITQQILNIGGTSELNGATMLYLNTASSSLATPQIRMTVSSSGEVGIGTTAPGAKLDIVGGDIRLDVSEKIGWGDQLTYITSDANELRFHTLAGGATARVTIQSAGNVGIGTTAPLEKLHIESGSVLVTGTGEGYAFEAGAAANTLDDYEEGSYIMTPNTNLAAHSSTTHATYTKIGRMVTVVCFFTVGSVSGTDTVSLAVPFTSTAGVATNTNLAIAGCYTGAVNVGDTGLVAIIGESAAVVQFLMTNDNAGGAYLTNASLAASDDIGFTLTYFV